MFKDLVKKLLALGNYTQAGAGETLGYKNTSSFQRVVFGNDIRLSVFYNVCRLCGFDIIITNNKGINISIGDYIDQNATDQ